MTRNVQILEVGSRYFLPCGHMPCLDAFGMLPRLLAIAIGTASELVSRRLVLFGHAGDEIFPEFNFDLSHRRGLALRALLLQDSAAWKLASFGASTSELSYVLAGVAATMNWDCDTNRQGHLIEGVPSEALRVFQTRCRNRYQSPQREDGLPSVTCWHGVYCVLIELVRNCLKEMYPKLCMDSFGSWPLPQLGYELGLGVFPCGASFSTSNKTKALLTRRVDLVFLPDGFQLPARLDRKEQLSSREVPIYSDPQCLRIPDKNSRIESMTWVQRENFGDQS